MYNMYITINIKRTTGILTAINVTDIHMIWLFFFNRILKLSTEGLFIKYNNRTLMLFSNLKLTKSLKYIRAFYTNKKQQLFSLYEYP